MSKLIVLQGLPGSGKTTKAFDFLLENPSFERRSIKTTLFHVMNPSDKMIQKAIQLFYNKLEEALTARKDILIDDINLNHWHINAYSALAKKHHYDFELIKMNVSVDECYARIIKRNQNNPRLYPLISHDELEKMNSKLLQGAIYTEEDDKEFVVYGLEDCLSDSMERRYFATKNGKFDSEIYYSYGLVHLDEVRHDTLLQLYNDIDTGYKVFIVTKRPEHLREETEIWLKENNIPYTNLIMRSPLCLAQEHIWKYSILNKMFDIALCKKIVDDNNDTLAHFEKHGIEAIDCGQRQPEKIA